eukprot:5477891-Ditylum_brightwellii.AAC.1
MEERKYMGKVQRRVTPTKSASTITSLEEKGRGQAENNHRENEKHTDAEMEPVEETEIDLLMLE